MIDPENLGSRESASVERPLCELIRVFFPLFFFHERFIQVYPIILPIRCVDASLSPTGFRKAHLELKGDAESDDTAG